MKGKVLIILFATDLLLLVVALAGNGLLGWLFLNLIALLGWLGIRKRVRKKRHLAGKKYRNRLYFQGQPNWHSEAPSQDESATRQYGVETITQRGDTVRSKGEGRVADYFYRNKIRYRYEPPVFEKDGRHRLIGCPDFYLYDYDVYVEYWGMSSVPDPADQQKYNSKRHWKMERYKENGYKIISLEQRHLDSLEFMFPAALKEATGSEFRSGTLGI